MEGGGQSTPNAGDAPGRVAPVTAGRPRHGGGSASARCQRAPCLRTMGSGWGGRTPRRCPPSNRLRGRAGLLAGRLGARRAAAREAVTARRPARCARAADARARRRRRRHRGPAGLLAARFGARRAAAHEARAAGGPAGRARATHPSARRRGRRSGGRHGRGWACRGAPDRRRRADAGAAGLTAGRAADQRRQAARILRPGLARTADARSRRIGAGAIVRDAADARAARRTRLTRATEQSRTARALGARGAGAARPGAWRRRGRTGRLHGRRRRRRDHGAGTG